MKSGADSDVELYKDFNIEPGSNSDIELRKNFHKKSNAGSDVELHPDSDIKLYTTLL